MISDEELFVAQSRVVINSLIAEDKMSRHEAVNCWMNSKTKAYIQDKRRGLAFVSGGRCYYELKLEMSNNEKWLKDEFI